MRSNAHSFGALSHLIIESCLRAAAGTRADLARHLGVPESAITRWASGERPMPVEVIPHLARWCRSPDAALGELAARSGMLLVASEAVELPRAAALSGLKRASLRLSALVEEAVADGEISETERHDIDQLVEGLERQIATWKASRGFQSPVAGRPPLSASGAR